MKEKRIHIGILESAMWIVGLLVLFFLPDRGAGHFSVCPLALTGIDWCPGCGLGRSLSLLMHLEIRESINMHPLGIPAFILIIIRIAAITVKNIRLSTRIKQKSLIDNQ